jgi:hypothetical protein
MAFAFVISEPEIKHLVGLAGHGVTFGGQVEEDAFKLGFDVLSAVFVVHGTTVAGSYRKGKLLIQNLSKMEKSGEKI